MISINPIQFECQHLSKAYQTRNGVVPALDGATAFVHARNLGDTEYEVWGYWAGENWYTPAAGRNFALGLDYDF